ISPPPMALFLRAYGRSAGIIAPSCTRRPSLGHIATHGDELRRQRHLRRCVQIWPPPAALSLQPLCRSATLIPHSLIPTSIPQHRATDGDDLRSQLLLRRRVRILPSPMAMFLGLPADLASPRYPAGGP